MNNANEPKSIGASIPPKQQNQIERNDSNNPEASTSQISLLRRQEESIELQDRRVRHLCAREEESGEYTPETRHNIELLANMRLALLKTRQELGLDPAYLRAPRPTNAPPADDFRDPVYPFLTPDEARLKVKVEELVSQGKITVEEVYTWAALSYRIENDGRQPYEG
jgi:hypothetical protein